MFLMQPILRLEHRVNKVDRQRGDDDVEVDEMGVLAGAHLLGEDCTGPVQDGTSEGSRARHEPRTIFKHRKVFAGVIE